MKEPDIHRGTPGIVDIITITDNVQTKLNVTVPFFIDDFLGLGTTGGPGGGEKSQRRVVKGDEIVCVIATIIGTMYSRATHVKVVKTKRDRQLAEQVSRMLLAGAVREQGVVENLRNSKYIAIDK